MSREARLETQYPTKTERHRYATMMALSTAWRCIEAPRPWFELPARIRGRMDPVEGIWPADQDGSAFNDDFAPIAATMVRETMVKPTPTPTGFPGQWAPTPSDWKYPVWPSGCDRFVGDERAE